MERRKTYSLIDWLLSIWNGCILCVMYVHDLFTRRHNFIFCETFNSNRHTIIFGCFCVNVKRFIYNPYLIFRNNKSYKLYFSVVFSSLTHFYYNFLSFEINSFLSIVNTHFSTDDGYDMVQSFMYKTVLLHHNFMNLQFNFVLVFHCIGNSIGIKNKC